MRVGIDATCWSNPRGYGRYARGLITALLAEPGPHEFVLLVDSQTRAAGTMPEGAEYVVVPTSVPPTMAASAEGRRSIRDLLAMTVASSRVSLDVLFFPSVYTYYPAVTGARIVLGIHDVIAEDHLRLVFPHWPQRFAWMAKSWLARRQADHIVTVSDYAKAGVIRRFGVASGRVWVVGEAPDAVFRPVDDGALVRHVLTRFHLENGAPYIMFLGGLNPHKNLGSLFDALALLRQDARFPDLRLLLVGPAEDDPFTPGAGEARRRVADLGLQETVTFAGYLPDGEVACLLTAADVLVLPSFEEGYGLPAVEAAACGTPTIATKNSPLPRLLAGAGLFVDPTRTEELSSALARMLSDNELRAQMGRVARERVRALTWQHAAEEFHALLAAIESQHSSGMKRQARNTR